MVGSALSPQAVVDGLVAISPELRSSLLLEPGGELAAHAGAGDPEKLAADARELLAAADIAAHRVDLPQAARLEVSSPLGGVFALRDDRASGDGSTLVAVTGPGVLPALVLYDMRMSMGGVAGP